MTRRSVLAAVSVAATAITPALGGSKTGTVGSANADRPFDPTRHGFGFYNWRTQNGPYPGIDGNGESVADGWQGPFEQAFDRPLSDLPSGLLDALSQHAREGLLEATRTNGYCYGMVFAAQRYFERPETIPVGFEAASEITHPNAPRAVRGTPVLDEILEYHTAQYLDFHAWLGRYALLGSSLIDYEAQLAELCSTLDAFGTAGITLFTNDSVRSHQVLVYDYERSRDRTTLYAYDPNYYAKLYDRFTYTVEVDTSGETPKPEPTEYGPSYDQFVHNEYDRIIGDRKGSSNSFESDESLYDRLFGTTLFVSPGAGLDALVVDPEGRPLPNTDGHDPLHYRYGASEGTYTIALTGREEGDYAVDVYASSRGHEALDERIEGSIAAGETDRYEVALGSGEAVLESNAAGVAALGAVGGYAYHQRVERETGPVEGGGSDNVAREENETS